MCYISYAQVAFLAYLFRCVSARSGLHGVVRGEVVARAEGVGRRLGLVLVGVRGLVCTGGGGYVRLGILGTAGQAVAGHVLRARHGVRVRG